MDIVQELLDYIECKYKKKYIGDIKLEQCGNSYSLFIGLNNVDKPLCIGGDFTSDDSCLYYFKKEIDDRRIYNSLYFVLHMKGNISLNGEKLETFNNEGI